MTSDRHSLAALRREVDALFTPEHRPAGPGMVGAEVELLPVTAGLEPRPVPLRSPVAGAASLLDFLEAWADRTGVLSQERDGDPIWYRVRPGGRITFEPGGQLEFSTAPRPSAAGALADLKAVLGPLRSAARDSGLDLATLGFSPWHGLDDVPLQVDASRYTAMDEYFSRVGPHGQRMMRLSAAMQVNLDLGVPSVAAKRWRAANLLSPVLRAMFANSAAEIEGARLPGGRSVTWDMADPGRTGVTCLHSETAGASPTDSYLGYALQVPVMMLHGSHGHLQAAPPGLTLDGWLAGDRIPPPSPEELGVHLSTLFPDVRPRGWLEIRAIDVPAQEWWAVPLLLLPALLYDTEALADLLDVLEPLAPRLPDLARLAPRTGLRETTLGPLAVHVLEAALQSARRFPAGYFDDSMLDVTEEFGRRYVARQRTQADDQESLWARL